LEKKRMFIARSTLAVVFFCVLLAGAAKTTLAQELYGVGDRVEWNIGDIWYPGTIYNAQGGRFQIERDGYGRTSDWVTAPALRRLPGTVAVPPVQPAPAPRPTPPVPGTIPGNYKIGDRVEWSIGDIWYAGTIYNEQGGQYQVNRDQYGRARELTTDLRRLSRPKPEQPLTGAAGAGPFKNGERVEVNLGGMWYRGNVGLADIDNDRYVVDREIAGGQRDQTVASAQLRRLAVVNEKPRVQLPAAVPAGLYECQLYMAGGTVGRLRIVSGGTYSGLTAPNAASAGPQGRFTYDQATGNINWIGGLQGLPYSPLSSALQSNPLTPQANGGATPFIVVNYQIKPGGAVNSMSCSRIGQ
jgi:hypothetical protein